MMGKNGDSALAAALERQQTAKPKSAHYYAHISRAARSAEEYCRRHGAQFAIPADEMPRTTEYVLPARSKMLIYGINGLDLSKRAVLIGRDTDAARTDAFLAAYVYARRVFEDTADYLNKHPKSGKRSKDMQCLRGSITTAGGGLQLDATMMVGDGSGVTGLLAACQYCPDQSFRSVTRE